MASESAIDGLVSQVRSYRNSGRIKEEVLSVLQQFQQSLYAKTSIFSRSHPGRLLLCIEGTIPIVYRGGNYNIPMQFWIPETFPDVPPMCFVTPTPGMEIKKGHRHVDTAGQCYLPYLHQWESSSNLLELIVIFCSLFGEDPPVFATQRPQPTPLRQQPISTQPILSHPQPISSQPVFSHPQPTSSQPIFSHPQPTSSQPSLSNSQQSGLSGFPNASLHNPQVVSNSGAVDPKLDEDSESDKQILVDRLTQKLQIALQEKFQTIGKDIDQGLSDQRALKTGAIQIREGIQALHKEKSKLETSFQVIRERKEELQNWLEQHSTEDPLADIDQVVKTKDSRSQQLLEAIAKSMAIDDTIYHLDRALKQRKISLDVFLREVRSLARQQFEAKAIANKLHHLQQASQTPANSFFTPSEQVKMSEITFTQRSVGFSANPNQSWSSAKPQPVYSKRI